jgi:hypothetical protein
MEIGQTPETPPVPVPVLVEAFLLLQDVLPRMKAARPSCLGAGPSRASPTSFDTASLTGMMPRHVSRRVSSSKQQDYET